MEDVEGDEFKCYIEKEGGGGRKKRLDGNRYLHGLRVVKGLDCQQGRLFTGEGDEGAAFALSVLPEHRALLDLAVNVEHAPDVVLRELFRQHAHEQLAI